MKQTYIERVDHGTACKFCSRPATRLYKEVETFWSGPEREERVVVQDYLCRACAFKVASTIQGGVKRQPWS